MRVGFAGTPAFAQASLRAIIAAGHTVPLVLTQPDRAAGRGMKLTPSPVKQTAIEHGITVLQPPGLKLDGKYAIEANTAKHQLQAAELDVLVVVAYGLILPRWVLDLPELGCLNIHASLLPRWRGAAPIQRAIEAGDETTGVTIMQMDEGLDTGDMLLVQPIKISPTDTTLSLHDKLASLGADLIVQALERLPKGELTPMPQPSQGATYAEKILKSEAALDLNATASELCRRVRAFNPFPGATLKLPGLSDPVKVWRAVEVTSDCGAHAPGDVVSIGHEGIDVATGQGVLRLLELQRPGSKRQSVATFVQSYQPTQP